MKTAPTKFYIESFGCQMNEHDTEKMSHLLRQGGYQRAEALTDADIVIVNTCCVREKAEQKFYSFMGRLRSAKKKRGTILGVTGCIAQLEKEGIFDRLPFIDFSLGPSGIHRIREAVEQACRNATLLDFTDNGCTPSLLITPGNESNALKAFVTIMKGCNNFCSYCVVPYVRGREVSRHSADILQEISSLASSGVREVTLLGQNVNSYNRDTDDMSFPELLRAVDAIDGIERIRFVTSHPKDLSDELINCFGDVIKLCENIHLPFQSGSDRILKLMNRGYTIGEYKEKIGLLRKRCNDISVTADCIVGFPGETDGDFQDTIDLIKDLRFDGIFSFAYSPRKFTGASALPGALPRQIAMERLGYLQKIQKQITIQKNKEMEGTITSVLVEGQSKNSEDELAGRTRTNKIVNFAGTKKMIGTLVDVEITNGYANSVRGIVRKQPGPGTPKGGF